MNFPFLLNKDEAQKNARILNEKAQMISPELFLICNYDPGPALVFGVDAQFFRAINNLYLFVIDASLINKITAITSAINYNAYDYKKLRDYCALVGQLRTAIDHNNYDAEAENTYIIWLKQIINKDRPETVEDYQYALQAIEDVAEKLVNIVESFVNGVVWLEKKTDLIKEWRKEICKFYKKKDNIFVRQFSMIYQNYRLTVPQRYFRKEINSWCAKRCILIEELAENNKEAFKDFALLEEVRMENEKAKKKKGMPNFQAYIDRLCDKLISPATISELHKRDLTLLPEDAIYYYIDKEWLLVRGLEELTTIDTSYKVRKKQKEVTDSTASKNHG